MKVEMTKAGASNENRNPSPRGIKVKTRIKSGALSFNHNQSKVRRYAF